MICYGNLIEQYWTDLDLNVAMRRYKMNFTTEDELIIVTDACQMVPLGMQGCEDRK